MSLRSFTKWNQRKSRKIISFYFKKKKKKKLEKKPKKIKNDNDKKQQWDRPTWNTQKTKSMLKQKIRQWLENDE